jgi:methionyl-tRNA synthetase
MKRIIVTSALPYANGPLHIGHIAGCYLPADIYVKYQRLKGRDIIHICGTDDHGVPITMKALQENIAPTEIVDKYYSNIRHSLELLGIEYTNFSRTSTQLHHKNAQSFFLTLYQKGYITPKISEQLYCNTCNQFLPERFVEGICPYCDNPEARGDQCEQCGRWLEPTMLKEPKCQICKNIPLIRKTKHWFLRLDLLQPQLEKWLHTREGWKENVTKFVDTWLKEGLEPRPVTRDISWGVPVPLEEAQNKVIYVWFEALIGYISSTIEWSKERWKHYWCEKETELIHFIGKDNIVFHAIVWPCMLLGHGDYVLPTQIPANEFLNLEGKKISTSRNWVVWVPEYLKKFEPDQLRYVLTANAPEKGDVDFTWDDFLAKTNNELSDILGNFVHRTLEFINKYLESKIPTPKEYTSEDNEMIRKIEITRDKVSSAIESFEFKKGLKEIMALVKDGNKYFDYNKPWIHSERTSTIIYVCSTLIANLSILLHPYLPFTARSIRLMLNLNDLPFLWESIGKIKLPKGAIIPAPKILFTKIKPMQIEEEKQKLLTSSSDACKKFVSFKEFKKMDIRIAKIEEAHKIKGTKKLLKMKISLGKEKRQIVAGIGETYSPQNLLGKKIVVLTNLEPKTIHGEKSEGMLLAAIQNGKPILLTSDQDTKEGAKVE